MFVIVHRNKEHQYQIDHDDDEVDDVEHIVTRLYYAGLNITCFYYRLLNRLFLLIKVRVRWELELIYQGTTFMDLNCSIVSFHIIMHVSCRNKSCTMNGEEQANPYFTNTIYIRVHKVPFPFKR